MTDDSALQGTPVQAVRPAAYTIPTDAPGADGTLKWDKTTMVPDSGPPGMGLELRAADAAKFLVSA